MVEASCVVAFVTRRRKTLQITRVAFFVSGCSRYIHLRPSTAASPNSRGGGFSNARDDVDQAASATDSRSLQLPPGSSRTRVMVVNAEWGLWPSLTWTCSTSTSTRLLPRGMRRSASHQLTRSNHLTGSALTAHRLPLLITAAGIPLVVVFSTTCSMPVRYGRGPTVTREQKTPPLLAMGRNNGVCLVGPTGIEPMTSTV